MKNRSITIQHQANKIKVKKIQEYMEYNWGALNVLKQEYVDSLKRGEKLHHLRVGEQSIGKPDWLLSRQWKNLDTQVYQTFEGWLELAIRKGRTIINTWKKERNLSDEEIKRLRTINKYKKWWDKENGCEELIKEILKIHKFPVFKKPKNLLIDSLTSTLSPTLIQKDGSFTEHEYWLSVRVLDGETVDIPVFLDTYYQDRVKNSERATNVFQLFIEDDNLIITQVIQETSCKTLREKGQDIALDWGLNTLISTSDGRQLGRSLGQWLRQRDEELIVLEKELKKNGVPLKKSQRRKNIIHRVREHTKNEINRVLNQLAKEDIKSITIEELDFRYGGLSKKMNRILSRSGRNAFKNKLKDLEETYGIETIEVNPAYTSQECSSCHFVYKGNRKGGVFECKFCGLKKHADNQAAINIFLRRSQDDNGYKYNTKEYVLSARDQEFYNLWGISPDLLREQYDTQLVSNVIQEELLPNSSISRTSQLCSVNSYHE